MNRVLFKAAAIVNIAAAALIYVACSGDDGKDGPPGPAGASCTTEPSTTVPGGIDVICGSDRKTLGPGPAGAPGAPGQNGQGVPADGCYLSSVAGGYNVICGGVDQGPLSTGGGGPGGGCAITENDLYININCGTGNVVNFAKAWCFYVDNQTGADVSKPYDPINGSCTADGIRNNCDDVAFDANQQFCALAKVGDTKKSIFARCGADYDDVTDELLPTKTGTYDPTTEFCAKAANSSSATESGFFAAGTTAGQISGNKNLNGEVAKTCGPRTGLAVADLTLSGSAAATVQQAAVAGYAAGKYTTGDFCAANNRIYPKCGSSTTSTYDPVARFCLLVSDPTTSAKFGTAFSTGQPTPRCGTESGNSDPKGFGFGGLGSYYSDKNFCASNTVNIKCLKKTGNTFANGADGTGTINTDASYDVAKSYCELKADATTATDYAAVVNLLEKCPAGSGTNYNPTTHFCGDDGQVYVRCGESAHAADNEAKTKYDPTKKFCDARGKILPNVVTTAAAGQIVYSLNGTQLDYVTIGAQTWTQKNLSYVPTGTSTGLYDWATAVSADLGCPAGWSVPTNAQWDALIATVNTTSGASTPALLLRTADTTTSSATKWTVNNPTAASASGFIAEAFTSNQNSTLSAAFIASLDLDATPGTSGPPVIATAAITGDYVGWWTKDEDAANAVVGSDKNNAIFRWFKDTDVVIRKGSGSKLANKLPVRCIKN